LQDSVNNIFWIVYGGSAILFVFSVAYVLIVLHSHKHKLQIEAEKLNEVRRSEEKYRTLFNHSLAGMIKFTYEPFEILDANEALLDIFLCGTVEGLHQYLIETIPDQLAFIRIALEQNGILDEYDFPFIDKDGQSRWLLLAAKAEQNEKIAYGVFRDITRRKLDEEKIKELAALLNQAHDGVIVTTLEGEIVFWNSSAVGMYGWESHEVIGKNIKHVVFPVYDKNGYKACREDVIHFGEWSGELQQVGKNKKLILVESDWQKIENQFSKTSVILVVNTDITEKRVLENNALYHQKMEAIALMTSGIAHDLQNILAPVSLSINILRRKMADPSGIYTLDTIEESTNNGLRLVKNIMMVGKGINGSKAEVDLKSILESSIRIFHHGKPGNIQVEKKFIPGECIISGDEDLLKQIFINLFQNAKDAMPDGGTLSVTLAIADVNRIDPSIEIDRDEVYYAVVEVADTGIGIPAEHQEKIFEPFFTTKEGAGGTGLGLPIVKTIIKNHGGAISATSQSGSGAKFMIYFPLQGTSRESAYE
jgi:two-component system, cell cycle sensor histidine kinase and response regulator CckA